MHKQTGIKKLTGTDVSAAPIQGKPILGHTAIAHPWQLPDCQTRAGLCGE